MVRLTGVVNIIAADALLTAARATVTAGGQVSVECTDAESFDMSALQILVALRRELDRQGRSLRLLNLGKQATEDIALAGLTREFSAAASPASPPPTAPRPAGIPA